MADREVFLMAKDGTNRGNRSGNTGAGRKPAPIADSFSAIQHFRGDPTRGLSRLSVGIGAITASDGTLTAITFNRDNLRIPMMRWATSLPSPHRVPGLPGK